MLTVDIGEKKQEIIFSEVNGILVQKKTLVQVQTMQKQL